MSGLSVQRHIIFLPVVGGIIDILILNLHFTVIFHYFSNLFTVCNPFLNEDMQRRYGLVHCRIRLIFEPHLFHTMVLLCQVDCQNNRTQTVSLISWTKPPQSLTPQQVLFVWKMLIYKFI